MLTVLFPNYENKTVTILSKNCYTWSHNQNIMSLTLKVKTSLLTQTASFQSFMEWIYSIIPLTYFSLLSMN